MGCGNCGSRGSQWVAMTYIYIYIYIYVLMRKEPVFTVTFTTSNDCPSCFVRYFCPSILHLFESNHELGSTDIFSKGGG